MSFSKKFLKHPSTQYGLSLFLAFYIWLVYVTNKKSFTIGTGAEPYMHGDANGIFAFWHGRMMLLPAICPPRRVMRVLISHHRDGILISSVIGHFRQKTVSGSTSRGGRKAIVEMLQVLEAGDNISITPDGPRGPAQVAAKGIIGVAKYSGKPILPVTFAASKARRFRSWDRFMLAYPFGRIVFFIGAPIVVAPEGDEEQDEQSRLQVELAMNRLVEQADGALDG